MLNFRLQLIFTLLFGLPGLTSISFAQSRPAHQLFLKSGTITPTQNILAGANAGISFRTTAPDQKYLVIIQFEEIPENTVKAILKSQGIELLEYIPDFAYTATVTGSPNMAALANAKAYSIITLTAGQKMEPSLLSGDIPAHALTVEGKVDVRISFPRSFSFEEVGSELGKNGIEIISDVLKNYQVLDVRISKDSLVQLAEFPFIQYIEVAPGENTPLNDKSEAGTKANVLSSATAAGFGLDGEGVVVGIGDNSDPRRHVDTKGRIINDEVVSSQSHGIHIAGTIAGAGIINEKYKGYAPKSKIIVRGNTGIWQNATSLVTDFGMVITNNSYAGSTAENCEGFGLYHYNSVVLDRQASDLPYLQHVFAAGNSGSATSCTVYPSGYGNVLGDYASTKNPLSVGLTLANGLISPYSSKGPVRDGRIKPDLTAPGTDIYSSIIDNGYATATGTSMASASVSGGLALLYQRYRQLNSNSNPKNALMKALACNGASDQGLKGPDYSYGFGSMNLLRSITMLNAGHYFSGQLSNGEAMKHSITVPANTAQLKVMLYWNDRAASAFAAKTLVNNLDMKVKQPDAKEILPLFPSISSPAAAAVNGVDDVNNIEQVVIDNPAAGPYDVSVLAKLIPEGVQEYFLVYDVIEVSTALTYPIGKEKLTKGDVIYISWESYGNTGNTFAVQYSKDGGTSWTDINNAVAANARQLSWTVPDLATDVAKVRVMQNNTGIVRESEPFTILGVPVITLSAVQCEGYASIQWTAVKDATGYHVMRMKDDEMIVEATTSGLAYTLSNLAKDTPYFISVRALKNDSFGRRGVAVTRTPNTGTCLGNMTDNDLKADLILSPANSGRQNTSSTLTANHPVTVRIKNLDDQISSGPFQVGYSIGDAGAPVHWETASPTISPGASYDHTFSEKVNLQNPGSYHFTFFVKKDGDVVATNNTLEKTFKQLANPVLQLPYLETFERASQQEILEKTNGVKDLDPYDFESSVSNGRLRTVVGSGVGFSGSKALTLDVKEQAIDLTENRLNGTFNLSAYDVKTDEIRLTFSYMMHGLVNPNYTDIVSIRGKDTDPWLSAFSLDLTKSPYNTDYQTISIDVSDILKAAGQQLSSSFQVRFAQSGNDVTLSKWGRSGSTFDDIRLFKVTTSDVQLAEGGTIVSSFCGNNYPEEVKVKIINHDANDCYNMIVKMFVDDKVFAERMVSFIPGSSSTTLAFPQPVVYASGRHTFKFSVDKPYDINPNNNSFVTEVYNTPEVSFADDYIENFESGAGGWRSEGANNSWSYGTPNSAKVKTAASGRKAWKTNLSGNHNNDEASYLYSPCFKTGNMQNPVLSFSTSLDLESCPNNLCDVAYVEYSVGTGSWERLGAKNTGTNWYNRESNGVPAVWNVQDYTRWHVSTIPLPQTNGQNLRLRFVFKSNSSATREGIAIDDIHIYDLKYQIYAEGPATQVISKPDVRNYEWNNFTLNDKIVASIQPRYQNLGKVEVQAFVNQNQLRSINGQYYLDRSFSVKPEFKNPANPVAIRLYFLDSEIEKLIAAPGPANKRPESAYDLGMTKFSDPNLATEDGELSNNAHGQWTFFQNEELAKVPYDKGYYVEFKIQTFSEFWFSKNFLENTNVLPVDLISFTAKKKTGLDNTANVLLEWVTSSEKDFSHFEVEAAWGAENVRQGLFTKIGEVAGIGNTGSRSEYTFTDFEKYGYGNIYYRLKMIDTDKTFVYAPIRSVSFTESAVAKVYPNPSNGLFSVEFQGEPGKEVKLNVYDLKGLLVKKISSRATGALQQQKVDLSTSEFPSGLYMLELTSGKEQQVFKVIRN